MGGQVVPLLSALAVLLTALAALLGIAVTRAAGRRTAGAGDLRVLLDERRSDRAEDRADIVTLEKELRMMQRHVVTLTRQLLDAGIDPADRP